MFDEELDNSPESEVVVSQSEDLDAENEEVVEDVETTPVSNKHWYILKVQVNREDSIKDAIYRRAAISGLSDYFGEIFIPTEKVTEFRNGKKRVTKKKLFPGYVMINMEITNDTYIMVRETSGVGDFTGPAGKPSIMPDEEVERMLNSKVEVETDSQPKLKIPYKIGDKIKVKDGHFENFEGVVSKIDATNGRVTVDLTIFGRSTPVELEYWQVEQPN